MLTKSEAFQELDVMNNKLFASAISALAIVALPVPAMAQAHFADGETSISGAGLGMIGATECEATVTGVTGTKIGGAGAHKDHTTTATVNITNTTTGCTDKEFQATVNADGSGSVTGNSVINTLCGVAGPVALPVGHILFSNVSATQMEADVPTFMFGGCPLSLYAIVSTVQWHS